MGGAWNEPAVGQVDDPLRAAGDLRAVGHENESSPLFALQLQEIRRVS